jgi:hypothetical protein
MLSKWMWFKRRTIRLQRTRSELALAGYHLKVPAVDQLTVLAGDQLMVLAGDQLAVHAGDQQKVQALLLLQWHFAQP